MMVIRKQYLFTCLSALILTSCSGGGADTFLYKNYTVADAVRPPVMGTTSCSKAVRCHFPATASKSAIS